MFLRHKSLLVFLQFYIILVSTAILKLLKVTGVIISTNIFTIRFRLKYCVWLWYLMYIMLIDMYFNLWCEKICFVKFHFFCLPLVTKPKNLHWTTFPNQSNSSAQPFFPPYIQSDTQHSTHFYCRSLTHETGRLPLFSFTSYKFLCMFRMCSHAIAQEIRRRAIIMGIKVKCSRFMDKRTKTHIPHDSQSISAINLMFMDPCIIVQIIQKSPTRCNRVLEFIISMFINCSTCFELHTAHHQELKNCNCSLWFYKRLWLPATVKAEWELRYHSSSVKSEAAITVFALLMMSGVWLETCWAINKHWNNNF
jgi:hypothetical protein